MADESSDVNGNLNPNASREAQGLGSGYTSEANGSLDTVIQQLREVNQRLSKKDEELVALKRQLQSQEDRLSNRLKKEWNENRRALSKAKEIEGWDEETYRSKLEDANQRSFAALSLSDLEQLEQAESPAPSAVKVEHAAASAPMLDPNDHANALRKALAQIGLTEEDFGGLSDFVGKDNTPELQREWIKRTSKALERREDLARQLAQRQIREQDAAEASAEVEQYGNLGGTTGDRSAGSASNSDAARLIEKEMKKYRGSGNIAEALAERRRLQERYGA